MKKIFFTLITFIVAIVASAQEKIIKVYEYDDRGELITTPVYQSTRKVKVVFEEKALSVSGNVDGYDYVDLGLPSKTLWATFNVGASRPEEYGDYFAWGETEPKDQYEEYKWGTYKWCEGSKKTLTKYCNASGYGTVDDKMELDPEDDAATANWSDKWCMPTSQQFDELVNPENTEFEWTFVNGVIGIKFTSKRNGNTIFFPAAGYRHYRALDDVGSEGLYWARDIYRYTPYTAMQMDFVKGSNTHHPYSFARDRYNGQSVRPVLVQRRY